MSTETNPVEGMRRMLQETHDSTLRQEGVLNHLVESHKELKSTLASQGKRVDALETYKTSQETEMKTMRRLGTVLATIGGIIIALAGLVVSMVKGK